jgi:hypothetical protein
MLAINSAPARVTIGVIPLRKREIVDAEVTPTHRFDVDPQTAEQGESGG